MEALLNKNVFIVMIILSLVIFPTVGAGKKIEGKWQWIDGNVVRNMISKGSGLWFIDVRSPGSYGARHIEGTVNISKELLKHKKFPAGKKLVLVDDSLGLKNARESAEMLVERGHEHVYVLRGGIVAWELRKYPLVVTKQSFRSVLPGELRWALDNNVSLIIYDLRNQSAMEKGSIRGSIPIKGGDLTERMDALKKIVKENGSRNPVETLEEPRSVIVVFSARDDAISRLKSSAHELKGDVRYLAGGYESYGVEQYEPRIGKSCPACPKK